MNKIVFLLALALMAGAAQAQTVDPYGNIIIGNGATISPPLDPDSPNTVKTGQIVIGDGAHTDGQDAIAEGTGASATELEAMARGKGAKATAIWSDADGSEAEATAVNSIAKGHKAKASAAGAVALGANSNAKANRCVALGIDSECDEDNTVSVGREGDERRITNVQNGRDDTDAVNIRQVRPLAQSLGGGSTYNAYGQFVPPSYNFRSGATYNNVGSALDDLDGRVYNLEQNPGGGTGPVGPAGQDGASAYQVAVHNGFSGTEQQWLESLKGADGQDGTGGGGSTVEAGSNVEVQDNEDGTQTVSVSDNVTLTDQGSLTVGNTTVNNDGVSIQGGPSMTRNGIDAGSQRITNVAPGRIEQGSMDAVNGGQIYDLESRWDDRWVETNKSIERVGAQSAALTMMASANAYLPVGKVAVSAAWGQYGSTSAFAVGAKVRLTERSSMSMGLSVSNGKAMGGIGYSLILD